MSKRIVITGASGHLGTALLKPLLDNGYSIQAQYRSSVPPISHDRLNWIQGEITDLNFLRKLFSDSDAIIHCAGMISLGNKDKDKVFSTNITGTQKVIEAISSHKNVRLIHISSTNAVANIPQDQVFDENSPYKSNKDNTYGYSKAQGEQLVLNAIQNDRLNALIIRPSALIGPPDYHPSILGQSILDLCHGKIPAVPSGGYDYVDIRDVANSIVRSIKLSSPDNIYNLTGKYYSFKELATSLSEATSRKINPWVIPIPIMVCLLPLVSFFSFFMKQKTTLTYESLMTLKHGHKNMSCEKAARDMGHKPRPLVESLTDLVEWFEIQKANNGY